MINEADKNHDGEIDYNEFIEMMKHWSYSYIKLFFNLFYNYIIIKSNINLNNNIVKFLRIWYKLIFIIY